MSKVWVCSDLHLGHTNIHKFRTQFTSPEEHHEVVMENLLSTVGKRDKVFLLGDIVFKGGEQYATRLAGLGANLVLVKGNHDALDYWANSIHGLMAHKGCWLSHAPMHEQELEYRKQRFSIHGHLHGGFINDPRYFNVSLEHTNYRPILMVDVLEQLLERN